MGQHLYLYFLITIYSPCYWPLHHLWTFLVFLLLVFLYHTCCMIATSPVIENSRDTRDTSEKESKFDSIKVGLKLSTYPWMWPVPVGLRMLWSPSGSPTLYWETFSLLSFIFYMVMNDIWKWEYDIFFRLPTECAIILGPSIMYPQAPLSQTVGPSVASDTLHRLPLYLFSLS